MPQQVDTPHRASTFCDALESAGPVFGKEAGRWATLIEAKVDYNF